MAKQPILCELKYFINGATASGSKKSTNHPHLVHCALILLRNLPASKDAVFEYFTMFFDVSVGGYVKLIEQKDLNLVLSYDETINEIQDVLESLIAEGQHAWAPYISNWSIRTLGTLSKKYKRSDSRDIASICNYWLGSSAMRCLLALTMSCFSKLSKSDEEIFTDYLLNTYLQNSTSFDWVIARLGSCFPHKIISNILNCGLSTFVKNNGTNVDSEIGILSYLSFIQDAQLKTVLKDMIEASLYSNQSSTQPVLSTIPYVFMLANKSDVMLQEIVSVFLILSKNDSFVTALSQQAKHWPSNLNMNDVIPSLTYLALRIQKGATKAIIALAEMAEKLDWCHRLLESILQEAFTMVNDSRVCSIFSDVLEHKSQKMLIEANNSDKEIVRQTAIRLIIMTSCHSPHVFHHAITDLLSHTSTQENMNGIEALIRLVSNKNITNESVSLKTGITTALEQILIDEFKLDELKIKQNFNVLSNLLFLVRLENNAGTPLMKELHVTNALKKCDIILIEIAKRYLNRMTVYLSNISMGDLNKSKPNAPSVKKIKLDQSDAEQEEEYRNYSNTYKRHIHAVMNLLDLLEIGKIDQPIAMDTTIKWVDSITKYFFWNLAETDLNHRQIALARSYTSLSRTCMDRRYSKAVAVRALLEGALCNYSNLFGVDFDAKFGNGPNDKKRYKRWLIKSNQKQNNTPNNIRSFLHAGIIGRGSCAPTKEVSMPNAAVRDILLNAFAVCCRNYKTKSYDDFETVAQLLVDILSPDIMYNGLAWPDEEFTRITMERDLHIRRTFKTSPILWPILALISCHRPAIWFASVILRSLCATLLHQWRAKSVLHNQTIHNNQELYMVTKNLLQVMAMGQLLVGPFAYLHIVIEYFEPFEIAVVLKECVWNNMKENIQSVLALQEGNVSGVGQKDLIIPYPQPLLVDPLRNIMQRKLSKIGMLYYYMFVSKANVS